MKILELFSGYGTASFALKQLQIPYELVGYSDIDKYANQCFKQNHCPEDVNDKLRLGDVTKINPYELPDFDLLTGGFPCQAFSVAGKGLGELDTRGTLFNEIIRIAEVKQPKYMLLENVKGLTFKKFKNTFEKILLELSRIGYIVHCKVLNTKDYGVPQNRERIWFVCFRKDLPNTTFKFPEPEKLKLFLKDILEDEVDKKYFLTKKGLNRIARGGMRNVKNDVMGSLTANMWKGNWQTPCTEIQQVNNPKHSNNRVYSENGVSPTLNSMSGGDRQPFIVRKLIDNGGRITEKKDGTSFTLGASGRNCGSNQVIIPQELFKQKTRDVNKAISIAIEKSELENKPSQLDLHHLKYGELRPLSTYIPQNSNVNRCLQSGEPKELLCWQKNIRKLTPKECFRLQGFLKDKINLEKLSDTQKYKLAGNGQSVNVVKKLFARMLFR